MKKIEGRARSIRELLHAAKYAIDFYQREYAWGERQVRELIDDLSGKFLDFYDAGHERHQVERYGHYFLGSVVITHKRNKRFIVDGQQRLTTLSLLLIFLHHLQAERSAKVDITDLIYSEKYGRKSFNLDIKERRDVMHELLDGVVPEVDGQSESVQNIINRYRNIADYFPEECAGDALPYFIDWLLENVHFVEIEAYSDEAAYTIFETMNDRGLSLSLPDMLKGYMLANIQREEDQRAVNELWKERTHALKEYGKEGDSDFFKTWLRARYAQTMRPGKKGAENKDYERIGSEFHRWVRDYRGAIGLESSDDFVRFVKRDLDFYARQMLAIREASQALAHPWESIYYNEDRGLTLQNQMILAALEPDDTKEAIRVKVGLVADFLDIWLARRVWNFRTIAYSSIKYTIFTLTREIRGMDEADLSNYLRQKLEELPETFASEPRLRLHQNNYRQIRHILARLTHWVEVECGLASHFEDLVAKGRARPFEIEHIWADHYDRYRELFSHPSEFETERNRLGGLILLQSGLNQSLGDADYERKREAYISKGENLLARSLHPAAYKNNPGFRALIARTGLPFSAYERFGLDEQGERQELYIRLAEWIWNPSRLDLDGEKPPVHEPIVDPEEAGLKLAERPERREARYKFWQQLLALSRERSALHKNISPSKYSWVGARKLGQWWNYNVLMEQTRVELYIDGPDAQENKALFDALFANRAAIEAAFGDELLWQRLDDKRACRVSYTVAGGWVDEATWAGAASAAVEAMERLYGALEEPVRACIEVAELEGR